MPTTAAAAPDLEGALARCLRAPSPFYRVRLTAAGPAPGDPRAALGRLPLTHRAELLRDQLAHLPHGTRRLPDAAAPVRVGTTGSGAELLVLAWSACELARERAAGARLLDRLGIRAGMRVANTLPGALVTPGALLLGDVIEGIGALDVSLGALDDEPGARQAWELVERVQPGVLVLEVASAARLFAAAPAGARPWWCGIVWLRRGTPGAPDPPPAPASFHGWQRTWLAVPEATSFVAHSCAAGRFHVDEDVLAEVVDETNAAPCRDGVLALTVAGGDAPLLRYATGLGARAGREPCSCGEGGTTVELR